MFATTPPPPEIVHMSCLFCVIFHIYHNPLNSAILPQKPFTKNRVKSLYPHLYGSWPVSSAVLHAHCFLRRKCVETWFKVFNILSSYFLLNIIFVLVLNPQNNDTLVFSDFSTFDFPHHHSLWGHCHRVFCAVVYYYFLYFQLDCTGFSVSDPWTVCKRN